MLSLIDDRRRRNVECKVTENIDDANNRRMDSCAGSRLRPTTAVAGRGISIYNIGIAVSDATHRLTDMCLAEYMLRDALRESLCVRLGIIETYVDRKRDAAG